MIKRRLVLALLAAATLAAPALAGDRETVEAFYTDFLNAAGAPDKAATAAKVMAPGWQSIGDYSGTTKSREDIVKQIAGFHQLIPDLNWKIEQMVQSGDTYVVRGRASGTPKGPLFGVDGKGRSFTIMSIDIHKVVDGRIVTSHHVEDWAGALRQLSGR